MNCLEGSLIRGDEDDTHVTNCHSFWTTTEFDRAIEDKLVVNLFSRSPNAETPDLIGRAPTEYDERTNSHDECSRTSHLSITG